MEGGHEGALHSENNGPINSTSGSSSSSSFKAASSPDPDPLVKSISLLEAAQESLNKELLKFKEINLETPTGNSVDLITRDETDKPPSRIVKPPSNRDDAEIEFENLFKQTIEADIEYLVISRSITQRLKTDQIERHVEVDTGTRKLRGVDSCFSVVFCFAIVVVILVCWCLWPSYEDHVVAT